MSNIYVQCAVVFGAIFVCLVAAMFCAWKAMDASSRRKGRSDELPGAPPRSRHAGRRLMP